MDGDEIIRADPKRVWRYLAMSLAAGAALILVLDRLYAYFVEAMPSPDYPVTPERLRELKLHVQITIFALSVAMACCWVPVVIYGVRIVRYRALPPPGTMVLRDTAVVRGTRAVWKGYFLLVLGSSCIVALLVGGWLFNRTLVG